MTISRSNPGYLDRLRLTGGPDGLQNAFRALARRDKAGAAALLNDEQLAFPTLYLLLPQLEEAGLYGSLSPRNRAAADLCARKHSKPDPFRPSPPPPKKSPDVHRALLWMFETGAGWDGPLPGYDAYDAVMDAAAALLVVTYRDKTVLPRAADLLFRRNRRGLYIHDLAWCLSQAFDPDAALLVARYLMSDDVRDVKLACRLLHLGLPENAEQKTVRQALYRDYRAWLLENRPFVYFTGEQFNLTSSPETLRADPEAVYLQKEISPRRDVPAAPLTEEELNLLQEFRARPREERELLSDYSGKLHGRDRRAWEAWMRSGTARQVSTAQSRAEVV